MSRKSTIVWIVSAVVVVGAGVGVAAASVSFANHRLEAGASAPASVGPATEAAGNPSASATPVVTPVPSDPASPSSSPSTSTSAGPSAGPTSKPVVVVKKVTPALTFFQWTASSSTLQVGGNVPGLVDAGGSCIVTATQGAVTVTQSFAASPQASSTECGTMNLTSPKLTSGTWNLTIGYRSPRAAGTSSSTAVTL